MRAEDERRLRLFTKGRDQIDELYLTLWRRVAEWLRRHLPAETFELFCDVAARFFDRFRRRWPRTAIDQRLNVLERVFAREFVPDRPRVLCLATTRHEQKGDCDAQSHASAVAIRQTDC